MFFTFFDFLAPLTSFKPSKTYIGVNQNENWSVMKEKNFTLTLSCGGHDVILTPKIDIFYVFLQFLLFSDFLAPLIWFNHNKTYTAVIQYEN